MIIKKLTSAEATAESIRAMILDGKLQPGEPLRQDTLSSELGVSRTPIRQAFQILADDGLVIIEGFKGARVMEVNMPVVRDL
ncbi:MAG: GntR family transcriptional regulator, partial [Alphaproteobacteria bacterium]|nr:GntR family transcriptional regulator [Alphaproteobacteria bacterium]